MLKAYMTFLRLSVAASCLLPMGIWAHMLASKFWKVPGAMSWRDLWQRLAVLVVGTIAVWICMLRLPKWLGGAAGGVERKAERLPWGV